MIALSSARRHRRNRPNPVRSYPWPADRVSRSVDLRQTEMRILWGEGFFSPNGTPPLPMPCHGYRATWAEAVLPNGSLDDNAISCH